jgi:molybdopterin synthase sulfur carrier subunit
MQVRVYATLRDLLGQSRLNVSAAEMATVGDVLAHLTTEHPALDGKLWDANHNLTGFVTVLLNGRSIEYLQGLETPVTDADVIALFPPVGGGWIDGR